MSDPKAIQVFSKNLLIFPHGPRAVAFVRVCVPKKNLLVGFLAWWLVRRPPMPEVAGPVPERYNPNINKERNKLPPESLTAPLISIFGPYQHLMEISGS